LTMTIVDFLYFSHRLECSFFPFIPGSCSSTLAVVPLNLFYIYIYCGQYNYLLLFVFMVRRLYSQLQVLCFCMIF